MKQADLLSLEGSALKVLLNYHKISDKEWQRLRGVLGRMPTFAELGAFSAMWSEHCSYKSSYVHLKRLPSEGPQVVVGPGENAGIVRIAEDICIAFKMESHNHPSFIEPFQGAATGMGGIMRDVFCMGARPIANLNALRFGSSHHKKTSYLLKNVVKGIGDYGNCVGVPTVGGSLNFRSCYNKNILVNAMCLGLIREDQIFKGFASGPGNIVICAGAKTGRDGVHGASMASASFESSEEEHRSAVQVGDPFMEKKLLEATLHVLKKNLVLGLQDMGAAGLLSSSFEMASRAGTGMHLNLDTLPTRARNMSAYEMLLSESQERMLFVVEPMKKDALVDQLKTFEIEAAIIGEVTDTKRMVIEHQARIEVDIKIEDLVENSPRYNRDTREKKPRDKDFRDDELSFENISHVYEHYDRSIGNRTVLSSEHGGAALLWLKNESKKFPYLGVSAVTVCDEVLCEKNAKFGAAWNLLKAYRSLSACGTEPLALTDCLNFGSPENPEVMHDFSQAIDGLSEAAEALGTAIVSGNVSLYNETDAEAVFPTPMVGMIGRTEDVRRHAKAVFQSPGKIFYIGFLPESDTNLLSTKIPYKEEIEVSKFLRKEIQKGTIQVCREVGRGGLSKCIKKMQFAKTSKKFKWLANLEIKKDSQAFCSYLFVNENESVKNRFQKMNLENVICKQIGFFRE